MYRLNRTEATAETGSRRLRAFEPENRMPHEAGGGTDPTSGSGGYVDSSLQQQILDLQNQLTSRTPLNLEPFMAALDQYNPAFFNTFGQIQGLAGAFSPDKIMALQRANQGQQLQNISQTFGRLGTGNTTAELNAINRAQAGFGAQDIQALMSGAQAQSGLLGQSLEPLNQGLTNLTLPEQLRIMLISAQNAGKKTSGGSSCGFLCLVLTDLLHKHGDLTNEQYIQHAVLSSLKRDAWVYAGYLSWATPLCRQGWLYPATRWMVRAYVLDMIGERPTLHGKLIGKAMRGLSAWLGNHLRMAQANAC